MFSCNILGYKKRKFTSIIKQAITDYFGTLGVCLRGVNPPPPVESSFPRPTGAERANSGVERLGRTDRQWRTADMRITGYKMAEHARSYSKSPRMRGNGDTGRNLFVVDDAPLPVRLPRVTFVVTH